MNNAIDFYIRDGWDLFIGLIDRGQYEGWFKASLKSDKEIIEVVDETPGGALKKLKEKLT